MSTTVTEPIRVSLEIIEPDDVLLQRSSTADRQQRFTPIEPFEVIDIPVDSELGATTLQVQPPTGAKFWLICVAISAVLLLCGLDSGILATAVPAITDQFNTVADVGWYYTAYRLCNCAFQFLFGKMYNFFSMKRVLLLSVVIFLVGSLLCATATSSNVFILGRAVAGVGASGVLAGCWNLMVPLLPLHKRSLFVAGFDAIESISLIASPILGGVLTQSLSWRWCFWINLPLGGVALLAIIFFLSDTQRPASEGMSWRETLRQLDLVGNLVFLPSMTCLFIALTWAGTKYAWNSPIIIGLLVAFAVLLGVFMVDQFVKQDAATLPPRILKDRNVICAFVLCFCLYASINIFLYYMPTYFQTVHGSTPAESGYMLLPLIIAFMLGCVINGTGTNIIGYYTPFAILCSILMPVGAGLMTTWTTSTTLAQIIVYSGLVGISAGLGAQAPQQAVQTTLPPADASLGMAVILFAQSFGSALCVSIAQTIFTSRLAANLREVAPNLDVASIENMGLTGLQTSLGPDNLHRVLDGIDRSLSQTWYLAVGLTCVSLVGSLAMEWRSVKQKTN